MKTIAIMITMMFGAIAASAQTKLGMSGVQTTYDGMDNMKFEGLKYSGYSAEVIHVEYLPDSIAQVFMAYAIYGDGNDFLIKVFKKDVTITESMEITSNALIGSWGLNESQKTGVISFYLKQRGNNSLFFETNINSDLPASFSEPFSLSTMKSECEVIPILPIAEGD